MSLVWDRAPYSGQTLLILLALADWADDEGYCWPRVTDLARKARVDRSTAKRALGRLESGGMIEFLQRSRGGIGQQQSRPSRRQKVVRLGHEIVINLQALGALPLIETPGSCKVPATGSACASNTASEVFDTGAEQASDESATGSICASDDSDQEISITGAQEASEDFHNWRNEGGSTGAESTIPDPSPALPPHTPPLHPHPLQPSVEPSVAAAAATKPVENQRWTLNDEDDGSFDVRDLIVGYQMVTGNRTGDADWKAGDELCQLRFSAVAVTDLMEEFNRRATAHIRSLAYFEPGLRDLAARCEKALSDSAASRLGAGVEEYRRMELGVIRRTVEAWRNGGKH